MPTIRRRTTRQQQPKITPEIVELYRTCIEIIEAGQDKVWEGQGGRQRELLDTETALDAAFGLHPWEYSPLWVSIDGPPERGDDPARHEKAQQLRQALQAALDASNEH